MTRTLAAELLKLRNGAHLLGAGRGDPGLVLLITVLDARPD